MSGYHPTLSTDAAYYWQIAATNTCGATESAEWSFQTLRTEMSVNFHEGVNVAEGKIERDATVHSLSPGTMPNVKEILLPDVPNLFTFSDAVSFHFEYADSLPVFAPAPTIVDMAVVDASTGGEPYADIRYDDLAGLTFGTPTKAAVTATITVVFQRTDGHYFKIGNVVADTGQWAVSFNFEEIRP